MRFDDLSQGSNCSDSEKTAFETGIKLATIYHQYIGTPVNMDTASSLETAISEAVRIQPFVKDADVRIDRDALKRKISSFGYCSLDETMIRARITVGVGEFRAEGILEWNAELNYPLMRIEKIE